MNHPGPVPVSVWLVCKSCRGSFHDVTAFLAHKTEKHFNEFKTVKSVIFEERTVKDDIDTDFNCLAGCHNLELPAEENKNENIDVVFNVKSSYINPRQTEADESSAEPDQRQVYTCKFTNPNQENAVDFTIEDECVIINISRLIPNLAESESVEQVNSEDFMRNVSAATPEPKDVYHDVDFDVETEDISHEDVLASNEAFEIEASEVNGTNANSATHDSSTSLLDINSDPTNADAQIPVSPCDHVIEIPNATNRLEANSMTIHTDSPPLNIDLTPQNFTTITIDPDCNLSVTQIVDATNYVVNTDVPLISENKIYSYGENFKEPVFNSGFNNVPESNLNCVKNPYVPLKRLTFEELELASAAQCVGRQQKGQNLQTDSTSNYSDHSQSDIESDYDPDFDPSDIDSDSNFEPKSVQSKPKKRTFPNSRFEVNEIPSREALVYNTIRCLVCNISFRFEDQLRRHNLQKHSNTRIKCTYLNCNQTLSCNQSLRNHLKSHENPITLRYVFPSQLDEDGTKTDNQDHQPLSEWLQNQPKIDNIIILEPDPLTTTNFGPISLTNPITCILCTKRLTSETQVKIHAKNCWTHNTKRHRYCVPCKKSFSDPKNLKFHKIKFHSTEEEKVVLYPFKCKQCNKKFMRPFQLKNHQKTHESDSSRNRIYDVVCHVCGKPDVHKSYLEDHLATHSNERPFKCLHPDCTVTCKSKMALGFHRRKVHAESRPFKCSQCSYTAKSTYDLKMHSFVHTKEKQLRKPLRYFRCTQDKCDKKYASREPLKIHMKKCHNIGPDLKTFSCQICKKTFPRATSLKNHHLVHSETREFKCTFTGCGKEFKWKSKLTQHEREHGGIKLYVCETCGKSYSKLVSFHKHKKSHENLLNQHLCSYCPRQFPGSWELKQHLLVHDKGAQFVCQFCGKKCSKKENLKIHEQSHNKPRKRKQQRSKTRGKQKKCTDYLSSSSSDSEDSE